MFNITDNIEAGSRNLLIMAGPCMAESRDICFETAEFIKNLTENLNLNYIFKASFDKANRSSSTTFRGHGIDKGLEILKAVKENFDVPIVTDIHSAGQAEAVAEVADVIQIPAFLCRQTDLLISAGKTGKTVNIKKGQFMAPEDMKGAVEKVYSTGNKKVMLTERGTTFGYHNLVVDMRSLVIMRNIGVPVIFDATHSVQLPGGQGTSSGGQREFVGPLSSAAAAVGIDGLFLEVHPNPDAALSDGPNSLNFKMAEKTIKKVKRIYELE
ncbi:MAG: 3-deoxy-8-phosphooctulonate synthase [Victivallales bacterium]|nr:3-deoxy-8-phosphooctulonate synthase [Victivallales bacterium]